MDISRKEVVPWGNWGAEKAVSVNRKKARVEFEWNFVLPRMNLIEWKFAKEC